MPRLMKFLLLSVLAVASGDSSVEASTDHLALLQRQTSMFIENTSSATGDSILGGRYLVNGMRRLNLEEMLLAFKDTQVEFFPEVNGKGASGGDYLHNADLLKWSNLLLAYTNAVYKFKDESKIGFIPVTPGASNDPMDFCYPAVEDGSSPNYGNAWYESDLKASGALRHDTQSAIYKWERVNDQILTLAFRGSEVPSVTNILDELAKGDYLGAVSQIAAEATTIDKVIRDWFGSDMDFEPVDDEICDKDIQLHNGFQEAYLAAKQHGKILEKLKDALDEMESDSPNKPVKVFVTGHSLGATLAALATYDIWCNKALGTDKNGEDRTLEGTITYGQPPFLVGPKAQAAYQDVVPVTKRIRVGACAKIREGQIPNIPVGCGSCDTCTRGSDCNLQCGWWDLWCHSKYTKCHADHAACELFYDGCEHSRKTCELHRGEIATCDIVASSLPGIAPPHIDETNAFLQPDDDDFQASWVRNDGALKIIGNCFGFPNAALCHMLDRYAQGLRTDNKYNGGVCAILEDSHDTKGLTQQPYGEGQNGFPGVVVLSKWAACKAEKAVPGRHWVVGLPLIPVKSSDCPANAGDLPTCDQVSAGLCEGDGECGTNSDLDNCDGAWDIYKKYTDMSCADGYGLAPVAECPGGDYDLPTCDNVLPGELCEGDGECGTDSDLDNCGGGWDIYQKYWIKWDVAFD